MTLGTLGAGNTAPLLHRRFEKTCRRAGKGRRNRMSQSLSGIVQMRAALERHVAAYMEIAQAWLSDPYFLNRAARVLRPLRRRPLNCDLGSRGAKS